MNVSGTQLLPLILETASGGRGRASRAEVFSVVTDQSIAIHPLTKRSHPRHPQNGSRASSQDSFIWLLASFVVTSQPIRIGEERGRQ